MPNCSTLRIRNASQSDLSDLLNVKPGFSEKEIRDRFQWLKDVDGTWVLLRSEEGCVGWCVITWSGKKTHPEYPDMQDLFIKSKYRNKGYGTYLIAEIERIAKEKGYRKMGLAVNPDDNPNARRLYERFGYQHDGGEKYLDGVYNGFEDWVIDLEKNI